MRDLKNTEDDDLVLLLKSGDHEAFEQIYHRYKGLLISHAYKKLGNFEDAKEIIQDIFSNLWVNREQIGSIKNLAGYLYVLVRNKILNHIEHQQVVFRYASSFHDFVQEQNYVTDLAIRENEMKAMISREIEALPAKMKAVFLLSRNEGLSHKEIADRLEISESTVKNHIKAALKVLRARLGMLFTLIV